MVVEAPSHAAAVMDELRAPVGDFYKESGGELRFVQALLGELTGEPVPSGGVLQVLNIDPAELQQRGKGDGPPRCSAEQLTSGLERILEPSDTAAAIAPKLARVTELLRCRKRAASEAFDESFALAFEERLLKHCKQDSDLREHLTQLRSLHDEWARSGDLADVRKWPCVANGPQVLAMDRIQVQLQSEILSEEEKRGLGLLPRENPVPFLLEKMAPHRAKLSGAVADRQQQRVQWYVAESYDVKGITPDEITAERAARADQHLCKLLGEESFQKQVGEVLANVDLGPAQQRCREVEVLLASAEAAAAQHADLGSGYEGVVRLAASRALLMERHFGPGGSQETRPDYKSRTAVSEVREKCEERFYRKKWLPLESNPEVFNQLGQMLGLPPAVEFYEVFGLDPDLLAMVPSPAHAVLVCFPLTDVYVEGVSEARTVPDSGVYFLRQTVPNACGTVALVHAFASLDKSAHQPGSWLTDFTAATEGKTPLQRAAFLEEDEALAVRHNQMAEEGDTNVQNFTGDSSWNAVLHFVCYVCRGGVLYELDGLKEGPVSHGPTTPETLLQDSARVVQKLLSGNEDEIRVNMMALAGASG